MKYVIVGGVAGGASAAARLRRLDETAEIVLFEKESIFLMRIAVCLIISEGLSKSGNVCSYRLRKVFMPVSGWK